MSVATGSLVERGSRLLAIVGMLVMVLVAIYTVVDVLLRYFLNAPLPGAVDIVTYGLALAVGAVMPWGLFSGQHVSVPLVVDRLPDPLRRVADALVTTVVAVFMVVLTWRLALFAIARFETGETMWILGIVLWPFWTGVATLFALACLVQGVVAVAAWRRVVRPDAADRAGRSAGMDAPS